ncbi:hypothetical protein [uncultured Roseibium sp.]|uniref:hypothetical protein n=1 Tax=uncultured Roseibium sp. TaxID=1936171 RepID=UPI0032179D77
MPQAADCPAVTVMVPKADVGSLARVADILPPDRALIALVETVEGLVGIHEVAMAPGVTRLPSAIWTSAPMPEFPEAERRSIRPGFQMVIASRCAGLTQPIDGVTVALNDEAVLNEDVLRARNLGFTAKLCIHPARSIS